MLVPPLAGSRASAATTTLRPTTTRRPLSVTDGGVRGGESVDIGTNCAGRGIKDALRPTWLVAFLTRCRVCVSCVCRGGAAAAAPGPWPDGGWRREGAFFRWGRNAITGRLQTSTLRRAFAAVLHGGERSQARCGSARQGLSRDIAGFDSDAPGASSSLRERHHLGVDSTSSAVLARAQSSACAIETYSALMRDGADACLVALPRRANESGPFVAGAWLVAEPPRAPGSRDERLDACFDCDRRDGENSSLCHGGTCRDGARSGELTYGPRPGPRGKPCSGLRTTRHELAFACSTS